jgi:hypothetical protein
MDAEAVRQELGNGDPSDVRLRELLDGADAGDLPSDVRRDVVRHAIRHHARDRVLLSHPAMYPDQENEPELCAIVASEWRAAVVAADYETGVAEQALLFLRCTDMVAARHFLDELAALQPDNAHWITARASMAYVDWHREADPEARAMLAREALQLYLAIRPGGSTLGDVIWLDRAIQLGHDAHDPRTASWLDELRERDWEAFKEDAHYALHLWRARFALDAGDAVGAADALVMAPRGRGVWMARADIEVARRLLASSQFEAVSRYCARLAELGARANPVGVI